MSETVLALVPLLEYQRSRAHLFPGPESLNWFVRKNKDALVQGGALLRIAGRIQVSPGDFDAVVLEVGKRAAVREDA